MPAAAPGEDYDDMSPADAVRLSAADRREAEAETARIRAQAEDDARRIEYVKARVRSLLATAAGVDDGE